MVDMCMSNKDEFQLFLFFQIQIEAQGPSIHNKLLIHSKTRGKNIGGLTTATT